MSRVAATLRWAVQALAEPDGAPAQSLARASRPIILIHGFAATSAIMIPLERYLRSTLGRPVIRVRLGHRLPLHLQDIRASARLVHEAVERLAATPGFEYADIVGYSLGGLVATYVLKLLDRGRRVRRVVTLGTPHRGTPLAVIGVLMFGVASRAVWQMLPRSPLLRTLEELPVPDGSEIFAIAGHHDGVVPRDCATLACARGQVTAVLEEVGHLQLPVSTRALSLVETLLTCEGPTAEESENPPPVNHEGTLWMRASTGFAATAA